MGEILLRPSGLQDDYTLIFQHVPKTAGSTLGTIIDQNYPRDRIFSVSSPIEDSLEAFRQFDPAQKRNLKAIKGHGIFGIHESLDQPAVYITMLRDPVDRVVSNYYFIRESPKHHLHDRIAGANMSLKDYVESGINPQLENGQVRALSGIGTGLGEQVAYGECTVEMLEIAKRHLEEHFAVAGLTERFDESLMLMRKLLRWSNPYYSRAKVTTNRPGVDAVPPDVLQAVRKRNRLDVEIYEGAVRKFDALRRRQSPSFGLETILFRLMNKLRAPS